MAISETTTSNDDASNNVSAASPPGAYADEFTIPVSADVGSVSLALEGTGTILIPGSTVNVSIRTNLAEAGVGGGILGTFTAGVTPGKAGIYTFDTVTKVHLNAGTEYWLTAGTDGSAVDWFDNGQGIDGNIASRSDGIWTKLGSETALAFSINSVPEPGSFGLCAVSIMAALVWRRRKVKCKVPGRL